MRSWMRVVALPIAAGLVLLFPVTATNAWRPTEAATTPASDAVRSRMSSMPLAFTENRGQWDDRVRFRASAGGTTIWFCQDGITYQFVHRVPRAKSSGRVPFAAGMIPDRPFDRTEPDSVETVIVHAAFVGANPDVELAGEQQMGYHCNYFLGSDPTKWQSDVPNYGAVVYRGIYPGVDLRYEGIDGALTSSYVAQSEEALAQVKYRYAGNARITEIGCGRFRVEARWGILLDPLSTSEPSEPVRGAGSMTPIAPLATQAATVTLSYSTYLGGGGNYDYGQGIAVDGDGNAYVAGYTWSTDFPTVDPYQTLRGYADAFVTKVNTVGSALVYSTYFGGSFYDYAYGIAVDEGRNVYLTGETWSLDFPTLFPYQPDLKGSSDVFVTKLGPAGNALVYSTFLGGGSSDFGYSIAVGLDGNACVAGETRSSNFPTFGPYQPAPKGGIDAFAARFNASGSALIYSMYLSGTDYDFASGIAVDGSGSIYVTGTTWSSDFPTVRPFQTDHGGRDAFVTKISSSGDSLAYSTYLGGNGWEDGYALAVDTGGYAYVTGRTTSTDFPTKGAVQGISLGWDAFVTKFSPDGSSLLFGTHLGGEWEDHAFAIALDDSANAYITGKTRSMDFFPTVGPYQANLRGGYDVFVSELSAARNALLFSTYLGGSSDDDGAGIAVDGSGSIYVTGTSESSDFPLRNPYDLSHDGVTDAFVTKFSPCHCSNQGDLNGDGVLDVFDVISVIGIAFGGNPDPQDQGCLETRGNVDNCGATDVFDVVYLIGTAFNGGANPVDPCAP